MTSTLSGLSSLKAKRKLIVHQFRDAVDGREIGTILLLKNQGSVQLQSLF